MSHCFTSGTRFKRKGHRPVPLQWIKEPPTRGPQLSPLRLWPCLLWAPKSLKMVTAAMKLRLLLLGRKTMTNLDSVLKSRDITLSTKVHIVKAMVFPVIMCRCELDHKEGWVSKNWYFQTVVLKETLESHFECKEIKSIILKEINLEFSLEELLMKLSSNILATWFDKLTHWKRPWCWERLKAEEVGGRGWDG